MRIKSFSSFLPSRRKCLLLVLVILAINVGLFYHTFPVRNYFHVQKSNKNVAKSLQILSPTSPSVSTLSYETSASTATEEERGGSVSSKLSVDLEARRNTSESDASTVSPSTTSPPPLTHRSMELFIRPHSTVWKKDSFCDKFIGRTFNKPLEVCEKSGESETTLECVGNSINNKMAVCTARNILVQPVKLKSAVWDCDACNIDKSDAFHMIRSKNQTSCREPKLNLLKSRTEYNDPTYRSFLSITAGKSAKPTECHKWINKTAYFFHSQRFHIYFRLYSYYNLHKTLLDTGASPGEFVIVRMAEAKGYKFENFERSLFPELMTLGNFSAEKVCFERIVFSPWAYASVMFRCKMEKETKGECLKCDGRGKDDSSLMSFRARALQACSIFDQSPEEEERRTTSKREKIIVFVKRKPYTRWNGDKHHNFQRVLSNQDEVIKTLKSNFSNVQVHDVFMEDLELCEQMQLVHKCDVYIGVHGAGLVHLWWLQNDAALLELAPPTSVDNLSFKTLAKLSGRQYHKLDITGTKFRVRVDINKFVKTVKGILS